MLTQGEKNQAGPSITFLTSPYRIHGILESKINAFGKSLAVQWVGFCALTAEGPGSIPGRGTKTLQACCSQKQTNKMPSSLIHISYLAERREGSGIFFFSFLRNWEKVDWKSMEQKRIRSYRTKVVSLFLINLFNFIYFWLHWVFVAARRLLSSCGEWGLLFVAVRGLLIAVASPVAEHGH